MSKSDLYRLKWILPYNFSRMPPWEYSNMQRVDRFISYSQNFITDQNLIKRLIKQSDISASDTVLEIGAGKGHLTKHLSRNCKQLISVEIDKNLHSFLLSTLKLENVVVINDDVLNVTLPNQPYKVFSNIPFNYTSRIMNKLFHHHNPPTSAYIIMQKEAGDLYIGTPKETQKSLFLKPFFDIKIVHKFKRTDFKPTPSVDINMLGINKLINPYLEKQEAKAYFDFVIYGTAKHKATLKKSMKKIFTHEQFKRLSKNIGFSLNAKPLDLTYLQWVDMYKYYKTQVSEIKKDYVMGSLNNQLKLQRSLKKVFRTRTKN